jgi:NAD+ diphosphatase
MTFVSSYRTSVDKRESAWWFVFSGNKLLVERTDRGVRIPLLKDLETVPLRALRKQYLGSMNGHSCLCAECEAECRIPAQMEFQGLRRLYGALDEEMFWVAGRAFQIVDWDRTHQYCGRCGSLTENKTDERAKVCPSCGTVVYPRMSPAIIVAVVRDKAILLAHAARFPGAMYSVLAGFVESGESLEDCVRREVKEEAGVELKNIRYFGSQPWPFPNSLMVGFTAEYAGGEITMDGKEIADAQWFTADRLPTIPDKISIARKLIDWFVETYGSSSLPKTTVQILDP